MSTRHCQLLKDEEGRKWVRDTSTNGTLLNGKRLEKNKEVRRGREVGKLGGEGGEEGGEVRKLGGEGGREGRESRGKEREEREVGKGRRLGGEGGKEKKEVGR